jgi:tRNA (cytidine/uridine-2'-O-)-methyltransferase
VASPGTGEDSAYQVVLYQPEIPQNTGNIARTCAATGSPLHLVEPLGFRLEDRYLKRAGLDYWPSVTMRVHRDMESLRRSVAPCRCVYFSAHAATSLFDFHFEPGDCLVFGSETSGLPSSLLNGAGEAVVKIPMDRSRVRSLNLATTVGVALFEAIRQLMVRRRSLLPRFPVDG